MGINKKIIILLVVLALAGAGVLGYKALRQLAGKKSVALPAATTEQQVRQQEFDEVLKKTSALDQDLDGIPDSEEAKYKTSATSTDTDEDGLTDWQEIFNFKTDPLKADTDADSFTDGYEVRRGTDPAVKGK